MNTKRIMLSALLLALAVGCDKKEAMEVLSSIKPKPKMKIPAGTDMQSVTNGISEKEFCKIFGEPQGRVSSGENAQLFYADFQVSVQEGAVYDIPEKLTRMYAKKKKPSALKKITDVKIDIPASKELETAFAKQKFYPYHDSQGKPVDHSELITSGKVTVIEFVLEENPACARIDREMEALIKTFEGVEFLKVNILGWNSDISKTYHIGSVPDIRILDAYGNLVAQPIIRIGELDGQINLSRVKEAINNAL